MTILEAQKIYEVAAIDAGEKDKTPEICGYYGRACRRQWDTHKNTDGSPMYSMLCGLCWDGGHSKDVCPIQLIERTGIVSV